MLRRIFSVFLFSVFIFGLLGVSHPVSAVTTGAANAACFCFLDEKGADLDTTVSNAQACEAVCSKKKGYAGYQYATKIGQYPSSNLQCWKTSESCTNASGEMSKTQPPECFKEWRYCYPTDKLVTTLSVDILGKTSVLNIAEYIDLVYRWLLGFSLVVTIVIMMIGGLRYVVGASSGDVTKAKDMIKKSIEGFVLLLFAYVILFTVNPQLIKLQVPKMPMIRQVTLLTGDETCEGLKAAGWGRKEGSAENGPYGLGQCGSVAILETKPDGTPAPEGATCMFTNCSIEGADSTCGTPSSIDKSAVSCFTNGQPEASRCLSCSQIIPHNTCNVTPSPTNCSMLDGDDTFVGDSSVYDKYNTCGWTQDPSMASSGLGAAGATSGTVIAGVLSGGTAAVVFGGLYTSSVMYDAYIGTCASMSIDCQTVTTCEGYDDPSLQVANATTDNELRDLTWPSVGDPNVVDICNQDLCGAGAKEGKKCKYIEGTGCKTTDYVPPTPVEYDHVGG